MKQKNGKEEPGHPLLILLMCVLVFCSSIVMIIISQVGKVNSTERQELFMSKKIVVITGSPRGNGNSFTMTDAFIKATEAKGHSVTRFDAAMRNIGGCPGR